MKERCLESPANLTFIQLLKTNSMIWRLQFLILSKFWEIKFWAVSVPPDHQVQSYFMSPILKYFGDSNVVVFETLGLSECYCRKSDITTDTLSIKVTTLIHFVLHQFTGACPEQAHFLEPYAPLSSTFQQICWRAALPFMLLFSFEVKHEKTDEDC